MAIFSIQKIFSIIRQIHISNASGLFIPSQLNDPKATKCTPKPNFLTTSITDFTRKLQIGHTPFPFLPAVDNGCSPVGTACCLHTLHEHQKGCGVLWYSMIWPCCELELSNLSFLRISAWDFVHFLRLRTGNNIIGKQKKYTACT